MKSILAGTQQLGRALMLPIAVLPVAALLLRLGQDDVIALVPFLAPIGPAIAAAGNAIFSNLGLLFAVGVAVGLARENHGAAGLAALVCYFVTTEGAKVIINVDPAAAAKELSRLSVPAGIISGLIAGMLYNRYHAIELPSYLAFFGGRRFVPIVSGFAGLITAFLFGHGFPLLQRGMDVLSRSVVSSGGLGLFVYGVLNRVLIVTGLHHILNNVAWQLLGEYHGVTGDLNRFFKGDPTAGAFMTGFFPVMMFGLPAACLAMYHTARPERRKAVAGLLVSMALTSFLTGITEPIEFSFMFLAPLLYALHAILTGVAMVVMNLLHVRLGFGFSAGLFDYLLNYSLATRPLWLLPVGALYFVVYYGAFRTCIVAFNLKTPGRDDETESAPAPIAATGRAAAFVEALGGRANLTTVDACATRLRLTVASQDAVDEPALKRLGARATVKVSSTALQVVLGPIADQIAGEIRTQLRVAPTTELIPALLTALGGPENIREIEAAASSRLRVRVANAAAIDETKLHSLGLRGIARPSADRVHVLVGPGAEETVKSLRKLLRADSSSRA
ncbi:MAG TPA: N-acetylglucosamine-specific PTS transporter subunit IIBC [Thermoanaerobaculia bacterium]|nr:N-acetylglucosamine-specific PTS transporter subunit IIBC [Thermoanaerobaculia bacterium]